MTCITRRCLLCSPKIEAERRGVGGRGWAVMHANDVIAPENMTAAAECGWVRTCCCTLTSWLNSKEDCSGDLNSWLNRRRNVLETRTHTTNWCILIQQQKTAKSCNAAKTVLPKNMLLAFLKVIEFFNALLLRHTHQILFDAKNILWLCNSQIVQISNSSNTIIVQGTVSRDFLILPYLGFLWRGQNGLAIFL